MYSTAHTVREWEAQLIRHNSDTADSVRHMAESNHQYSEYLKKSGRDSGKSNADIAAEQARSNQEYEVRRADFIAQQERERQHILSEMERQGKIEEELAKQREAEKQNPAVENE